MTQRQKHQLAMQLKRDEALKVAGHMSAMKDNEDKKKADGAFLELIDDQNETEIIKPALASMAGVTITPLMRRSMTTASLPTDPNSMAGRLLFGGTPVRVDITKIRSSLGTVLFSRGVTADSLNVKLKSIMANIMNFASKNTFEGAIFRRTNADGTPSVSNHDFDPYADLCTEENLALLPPLPTSLLSASGLDKSAKDDVEQLSKTAHDPSRTDVEHVYALARSWQEHYRDAVIILWDGNHRFIALLKLLMDYIANNIAIPSILRSLRCTLTDFTNLHPDIMRYHVAKESTWINDLAKVSRHTDLPAVYSKLRSILDDNSNKYTMLTPIYEGGVSQNTNDKI